MVRTWGTEKGADFTCPHCGSIYETTLHRIPQRDKDNAICNVCGREMDSWNSTEYPVYQLKSPAPDSGKTD
jgi:transcription elongation factor Elf1